MAVAVVVVSTARTPVPSVLTLLVPAAAEVVERAALRPTGLPPSSSSSEALEKVAVEEVAAARARTPVRARLTMRLTPLEEATEAPELSSFATASGRGLPRSRR